MESLEHARFGGDSIRIGTLNLRNTSDRWPERYPLLAEQLSELSPDIIGFQELRRPALQGRRIERGANAGRDSSYRLYRQWKSGLRWLWEGLAILTELPVLAHERLDLGSGNRIAQRLQLALPGDRVLDFYNTHLHHASDGDELRLRQVERILDWMKTHDGVPQVLVGDFNARPDDAAIRAIMNRGGLHSAFIAVHGVEPAATVPTPLGRHRDDEEKVIDYIFVNDLIEVQDAWITFDRAHDTDERLSASDHFGLAATISLV
jgi:endonuclease/exonuclease/phosphatase family metal-dependent hydrolase